MHIIYLFKLAGRAYVGMHEVKEPAKNIARWPRTGRGALPDGYRGSGKCWEKHYRQYGISRARYRIVKILDEDQNPFHHEKLWMRTAFIRYGCKLLNHADCVS